MVVQSDASPFVWLRSFLLLVLLAANGSEHTHWVEAARGLPLKRIHGAKTVYKHHSSVYVGTHLGMSHQTRFYGYPVPTRLPNGEIGEMYVTQRTLSPASCASLCRAMPVSGHGPLPTENTTDAVQRMACLPSLDSILYALLPFQQYF